MTLAQLETWVEANPGKSILIGGGLVILILWLFGAFSKAPADNTSTSLASAYYAAEAQQAVVGGQIQMANIGATADTAKTLISANAAQAINQQNATAATTIATGQFQTAATINQQNTATAIDIAGKQLQLGLNNNATLADVTKANNDAALKALNASI